MADNMIIASHNINIKEGQQLSLNLVLSAVKLAQCHLEQIPADYKDLSAAAYHVDTSGSTKEADGDINNDPTALQAHIAKKQRVLHLMQHQQNKTQGAAGGTVATPNKGGRSGGAPASCGHGGWCCCGRCSTSSGGLGGGTAGGGYPFQPASRACNTCGKFHQGNPPEEECWQRNLAAEQIKLDALQQKLTAAAAKAKDREEQRQHHKAQYIVNKTDDIYTVSFSRWDPTQEISPQAYSTICLNVTQSSEYLKGAAVDSASPINIQNEDELAQLTCGANVFLKGIIPGAMEVPAASCSFPTIDIYGRPVVLRTKGKGILHTKATSKVNFEVGRSGDHQDSSLIEHPNGTTVQMIYTKGIWRLPVLTREKAAATHHGTYIAGLTAETSGISYENPYRVLLDLANKVEPIRELTQPTDMEHVVKITQDIMQLLHDRWSHPSNSKMEQIVRYYKLRGFPPGFLTELKHFRCKVCALCKGARVYKHTKLVKDKMESNKRAKKSKNWAQVLLETDLTVEEDDDLLQAFKEEELHMDYTHSIAL
eukprot:3378747-Rhodomonas_salina.1